MLDFLNRMKVIDSPNQGCVRVEVPYTEVIRLVKETIDEKIGARPGVNVDVDMNSPNDSKLSIELFYKGTHEDDVQDADERTPYKSYEDYRNGYAFIHHIIQGTPIEYGGVEIVDKDTDEQGSDYFVLDLIEDQFNEYKKEMN
ncbi:hypothetical protein [Priestia aryabhattai]|uniref:hypothetical protein n=1 Tax=Priestia aryabhattai TaxID=412384 RepID=UPI003736D466